MMEGGPKQPEYKVPEEVRDFITIYLGMLPLADDEKRELVSLVAGRTLGYLTIFAEGVEAQKILIDPTKTDVETAKELTDAFEAIFSAAAGVMENDRLPIDMPEIKMSIAFTPLSPQQLQ